MSRQLLEHLESRQLLSASLSNGTLTVGGTAGSDQIVINKATTQIVTKVGAETKSFALSKVLRIVVNAGSGNDSVTTSATLYKPTTINGGRGNDTLRGGSGRDTVNGGDGNDTIRGGSSDDDLNGNTGDDLIEGGGGNDDLDGGIGKNVLRGGEGADHFVRSGGSDSLPDKDHDDHDDDDEGAVGYGTIVSVDAAVSSITLAVGDAGTTNKTFTVSPTAKIKADGVAVSLAALNSGLKLEFQTSVSDPTVITEIELSGSEKKGTVATIDVVAGTVTLAGDATIYTVAAGALIRLAGKVTTLDLIPVGSPVELKLSALAPATIVKLSAGNIEGPGDGDDDGPDEIEGRGTIVAVDTTASTITLAIAREGQPVEEKVFTVTAATKIKVDGVAATLASLPTGLKIEFEAPAATPTVLSEIEAEGTQARGIVSAVDLTASTITLAGETPRIYSVSAAAVVRIGDMTKTLADVVVGSEVSLKLSALSPTTAIAISVKPPVVTPG